MKLLLALMLALVPCASALGESADVASTSRAESVEEARAEYASRVASWRGSVPKTTEPEESPSSAPLTRMLQGLFFCIAVLVGGSWVYRRIYLREESVGGARKLRVVERLPLGTKGALCLVEVDGRRILVGMGSETFSFMELSSPRVDDLQGGVWCESESEGQLSA